jgi:hypothetical protein
MKSMNTKNLALTTVLTLTLVITSLQVVGLVSANYSSPPSIEIFSPIPAPDVHATASVPFQVRVNVLTDQADIAYISYSLDGKANITLTNLTREDGLYYWTNTEGVFAHGNAFSVEASLDNLAEGNHTLIVYSHASDGREMSRVRSFTVDFDYLPPQVQPSMFPNGTMTPSKSPTTQNETPIATKSDTPFENTNFIPVIIIGVITVSLLVIGLYFKKRRIKWIMNIAAVY